MSDSTSDQKKRTLIMASHIVAYQDGGHRYLHDGHVLVEGDRIAAVGHDFDGTADEIIDARGKVVTPGLISTHAHLGGSPLDKSLVEDLNPRDFYGSMLFEMLPTRSAAQDVEAGRACLDFSMVELLRGGCTTVLDQGGFSDYAVARAGETGVRYYVGPMFRSGTWYTDDSRTVKYRWDEAAGEAGLDRAISFIEKHHGSYDGRIRGVIAPAQIDTCTPDLLRRAKDVAERLNLPLTLHAAQSVNEFQEMTHRHGRTPIEWLSDLGFLGPNTLLGHVVMIGGCSWTNYPADDIRILADTGTSVAHAAWVFSRRGAPLESFGRYLRAGINVALGTDTSPQSMIEAMRWAAITSKIVDRNGASASAADAFDAATLAGARALGRDDLGRIAPGAKADLVIWDAATLSMSPVRDPIKTIVHNAQIDAVETVLIDGRVVMRDRVVPGVDQRDLARRLQEAGERMWGRFAATDRLGRSADDLSPQLYQPYRD